ncbi:MAG TPA: hypothetical protein VGM27_15030 [Acidobacteriaceae bacterium]
MSNNTIRSVVKLQIEHHKRFGVPATFSVYAFLITGGSEPANVHLARGELRVDFKTVEELASAMMFLGIVLSNSLDDFAAQYEPEPDLSDREREEREREKQEAEFFRNFGR